MVAQNNPYELWEPHTLLTTMRPKKVENWYFGDLFYSDPSRVMLIEDEWIDLEKLPLEAREVAPYVKPLGRGHSVYVDSSTHSRFKPAYSIVEEEISPLDGLSVIAGVDPSVIDVRRRLSVMDRRRALKALKSQAALKSIQRTWEVQRARGIIDGKITCVYKDGSSVLVDFQRNPNFTEILTGANRWGQAGISIMDHFQRICDSMNNADFGGLPIRATMGANVWNVMRKDTEILANMDKFRAVGGVVIERGVVAGTGGSKVFKVGTLAIGGGDGVTMELWVNNENYTVQGTSTRYLGINDIVFTSDADTIGGMSCFGRIVDQDAEYQAIPIFPKNFLTGDDVKTEMMTFKSAPLSIPLRPDATYKVTPV